MKNPKKEAIKKINTRLDFLNDKYPDAPNLITIGCRDRVICRLAYEAGLDTESVVSSLVYDDDLNATISEFNIASN